MNMKLLKKIRAIVGKKQSKNIVKSNKDIEKDIADTVVEVISEKNMDDIVDDDNYEINIPVVNTETKELVFNLKMDISGKEIKRIKNGGRPNVKVL